MRIAVLGGGVIGTSTAWYLRTKGFEVTLIDRQLGVGLETSYANGGQISVSHAEPWANPRTPLKALRWLARKDAPLLFRLRADRALLAWSAAFLRECLPWRTRANIGRIVELASYSRGELQQLRARFAQDTPLCYDHQARGILHIYTHRGEYAHALRAASILREFGCDRRPVSVDECIAIEPALTDARKQMVGGDFTAEDESGDAHRFTQELGERCRQAGVSFRFGTTITNLERDGQRIVAARTLQGEHIQADGFIVAAGSASPILLTPLGVRVPVYPAKGYSATIPLSPDSIAPRTSLTDDGHKLVFSRLGNTLRVAGTAEFDGFNLKPDPVRQEAMMRRVQTLFPQLRPAGTPTTWCGLRPATPNGLPLVGETRYENLWLNTGHGTLGWTMACGSAAALSDLIAGKPTAVGLLKRT
jgi:D-amino-acid dehydrogenase